MKWLKRLKRQYQIKRIAIVTASSNPVIKQTRNGFITGLTSLGVNFNFDLIIGNNNREELTYMVQDELRNNRYDLIFTLGKMSTQAVKEVTTIGRIYTPVLFSGVVDPIGAGIVSSEASPGNNFTGLSAQPRDYEYQMNVLLQLKRNMRKMVFVYNPITVDSLPNVKKITDLFRSHGIETKEVIIENSSEIIQRLKLEIDNTDLITVPRDNSFLNSIGNVINFCNSYRIPLYTSDLESVRQGAAIGFGDSEYEVGIETAKKAYEVLITKQNLPISQIRWESKLLINSVAARAQELSFDTSSLDKTVNFAYCS